MEQERKPRLSVSCGAICEQDGKILMVKEYRPTEGVVFNQPVGKLEFEEDIFEGTRREVKEETGLDIELTHFLGAYVWLVDNGNTSIRFCFVARVVQGILRAESRLDNTTVEPLWLSREELYERENMFRNLVTKKCLADYFAGKRYPLEVVATLREK